MSEIAPKDCNEETELEQNRRFNDQKNEALDRAHQRIAELEAMYLATKEIADGLAANLEALKDPACVWANMLRGTIARPLALDHYEECKAHVERLEHENAELKAKLSGRINSPRKSRDSKG